MVLYHLLRIIAGVALRWFYREVTVRHVARVPRGRTPLLLAVNHPNALVDALLVGWAMPRRITITAKATLFESWVLARLLRYMGVVPLRRASDEQQLGTSDRGRNADAFRAIIDRLDQGGAVLIFPEGKSHDEPALAPLRTGPARIALQARREGRAQSLVILPIGLVFERKDTPRSRVLVDVGESLDVHTWAPPAPSSSEVDALTEEIERRLRDVTLNYTTEDEAVRARGLARIFTSLLDRSPPIETGRSLKAEIEVERQLAQARRLLDGDSVDPAVRERAQRLLDRLDTFESALRTERIAADDLAISLRRRHGIWFALREGAVLAAIGPAALWGRVNHWIPFRLARALGERDLSSRDQPAMRTILAGLVLVLLFYGMGTALVARLGGSSAAAAYLISLPLAADVDLRFAERMRRARRRMRAYVRLRRDPQLRAWLAAEHAWLTSEITALVRALEREGEETSRGQRLSPLPP